MNHLISGIGQHISILLLCSAFQLLLSSSSAKKKNLFKVCSLHFEMHQGGNSAASFFIFSRKMSLHCLLNLTALLQLASRKFLDVCILLRLMARSTKLSLRQGCGKAVSWPADWTQHWYPSCHWLQCSDMTTFPKQRNGLVRLEYPQTQVL